MTLTVKHEGSIFPRRTHSIKHEGSCVLVQRTRLEFGARMHNVLDGLIFGLWGTRGRFPLKTYLAGCSDGASDGGGEIFARSSGATLLLLDGGELGAEAAVTVAQDDG